MELLLKRLDDPLRHAVALWLAHEGGRAFDPEGFDLVLEVIGEVVGAVVVAKDQTGRDVFPRTRSAQIRPRARCRDFRGSWKPRWVESESGNLSGTLRGGNWNPEPGFPAQGSTLIHLGSE